jgi:hypothetical protein
MSKVKSYYSRFWKIFGFDNKYMLSFEDFPSPYLHFLHASLLCIEIER